MAKREPPRSQEFIESSGEEEEEQEQQSKAKAKAGKDTVKKGPKRQKVESASEDDVKGKVKAESAAESASEDEEKAKPVSKKGKAKAEPEAQSIENPFERNSDGAFVDIGGKRRLTINEFKGNLYVGLREYYEDKKTGELLPGKKGISLNIETYEKVRDLFASGVIDQQIAAMSSGQAKKGKK